MRNSALLDAVGPVAAKCVDRSRVSRFAHVLLVVGREQLGTGGLKIASQPPVMWRSFSATVTFRFLGLEKKAMPGRCVLVQSDHVPGRVNSKYDG
jgi:hypothetical protein